MRRFVALAGFALVVFGAFSTQALAGTIEGTVRPIESAQEVEVCVGESPPGERCVVPRAESISTGEWPIRSSRERSHSSAMWKSFMQ